MKDPDQSLKGVVPIMTPKSNFNGVWIPAWDTIHNRLPTSELQSFSTEHSTTPRQLCRERLMANKRQSSSEVALISSEMLREKDCNSLVG